MTTCFARHPARSWRFKTDRAHYRSDGKDELDEVVVDHWLHVERLDKRSFFVQITGIRLWVYVGVDGNAVITSEEREDG